MNNQSTIAATLVTLALTLPSAAWAESNSEKELNAATFSESESETQLQEEEAVEKKDGMDDPAARQRDDIKSKAMDAATGAAGAAAVPK
jgi:hypothetical protein